MIGDDEVMKTLVEFFLEEFSEDGCGVGEWLAQNGQDVDDFVLAVKGIKRRFA